MLTIQSARDPVYQNEEGTSIHVYVKFYEFNEEMGFSAVEWDTEPHGVELYNRAKAGEFGPVAPYVYVPNVIPE